MKKTFKKATNGILILLSLTFYVRVSILKLFKKEQPEYCKNNNCLNTNINRQTAQELLLSIEHLFYWE